MLGLAVRSVQLMVDRAELEAWRTSGGHRRISRESVTRWLASRQDDVPPHPNNRPKLSRPDPATQDYRILLIEDSAHFQNLVGLLIRQHFPKAALHIASAGISGLAKFGQIQPDLLLVDILRGAHHHPAFRPTVCAHQADHRHGPGRSPACAL